MKNRLARYAQLKVEILEIQDELRLIENELKQQLNTGEMLEAHGFKAHWKSGRKSVDHENAVLSAALDGAGVGEIIEKHTTIKKSTAWAKVTKELKLDLTDYTELGVPQFKIDIVG